MDRERARSLDRVEHGGSDDRAVLDLSANVNPRTPDGVDDVYEDALPDARRYPPEPPDRFCEAAAEYVDSDPAAVVATPGGLAAIRVTISLAVDPGDSVLVPAPSFGAYAREVRLQGGTPAFVSYEGILDADPEKHALAIVCNPNNPTGTLYSRRALCSFADRCRSNGTHLLVDEAFLGFTDAASLAGTRGVTVARSLTKLFGLPGIRVGFAVGTGAMREALVGARRPWNVSAPALSVGAHCMSRDAFVAGTRERIDRERARLREGLADRFDIAPSAAPFLLVDVGDRSVDAVLETAADRDLALRDARTFRGLDNHVRVALRDREATERTLEVFDAV